MNRHVHPNPPFVVEEQETYKGWTVLGQVDLDSFVDSHVTTAQEFEENYKAVRARRREAEKLPEVVKVRVGSVCYVARCAIVVSDYVYAFALRRQRLLGRLLVPSSKYSNSLRW